MQQDQQTTASKYFTDSGQPLPFSFVLLVMDGQTYKLNQITGESWVMRGCDWVALKDK